jgi:AraC-like DNA-binding protein
MDPILEKIAPTTSHSFSLKEDIMPHITIGWHHHPEYELTLQAQGEGTRVIGDHVSWFDPGDLLLIGPNLPHYMRNAAEYYEGDPQLRCRAIVVHFLPSFLGDDFFLAPELASIRKLLNQSARGIHIHGNTRDRVAENMEAMLERVGYQRLMILLETLHLIAGSSERTPLASVFYSPALSETEAKRINKVFEYMLQHFHEDISLSHVANLISLSPSAFCKFFKKRTGKTFSHTLNEIRIGHACKLLLEDSHQVGDACYLSGYNTPSYFNRQFKAITGFTPLQYRKHFHASNTKGSRSLGE